MQKTVDIKKVIVAGTVGLSFIALFSLMLNLLLRNLSVYFCPSIYDTNRIFFSFCISAAECKKTLQITCKQDERFYNSFVEHYRKHLPVSLFLLSHNLYKKYHARVYTK